MLKIIKHQRILNALLALSCAFLPPDLRANYQDAFGDYYPTPAFRSWTNPLASVDDHLVQEENRYISYVEKRSRWRAEVLREKAKENSNQLVLKFVGIGAGPFNAIYVANRKFPEGSAAVLEASEFYGTFHKLEGAFLLNSEEKKDQSGNLFVGCPLQVKQHNLAGDTHPNSKVLGRTTLNTYDYAQVAVLTHERVNSLKIKTDLADASAHWPARYQLTTESGLTLYAEEISIASGLGEPLIHPQGKKKVSSNQDQSEAIYDTQRSVIANFNSSELPLIETSDDFLLRYKERVKSSLDPLLGYRGKKLVVVGGGHGAMTVLLRLIETSRTGESPAKIFWVGFKGMDARSIYRPIEKAMDDGIVIPMYQTRALQSVKGEAGAVRLTVFDYEKYQSFDLLVDQVISAYGYKNEILDIFGDLKDRVEIKSIRGFLPAEVGFTQEQITLGKQVHVDGKSENIYLFGSLQLQYFESDDFRSEELNRSRLGTIIELLGGRVAQLASIHEKMTLVAAKKNSPAVKTSLSKKSKFLNQNSYAVEMELRKILGRVLSSVKIDTESPFLYLTLGRRGKQIFVKTRFAVQSSSVHRPIAQNSPAADLKAQIRMTDTGIDPEFITKALQAETTFGQVLNARIPENGSIYFEIPLEKGIPRLHYLKGISSSEVP